MQRRRHPPDVVLSVRDVKAPGTLRVIDTTTTATTIYLRPPAVFIEPEPLLLTLRNLLMKGYEGETASPSTP